MAANSNIFDVAIIGSGPAAFTAAIYTARENLSVTIYERAAIGGLAGTISKIENFPGFTGTGTKLMANMRTQAESFGATVEYGECTAIKKVGRNFRLTVDDLPVQARSVIIATGSERRRLNIPGEDTPNVSYCATCDGPLTTGKDVVVIGGGNSATQEAFFLLKYAHKVTIMSRSPLSCNDILKKRLKAEPRIAVITGATPEGFISVKGKLTSIEYSIKNTKQTIPADYAFIFIGIIPATSFLPKKILDKDGAISTDQRLATTIPGLFAAGDCRHGSAKQAIAAAGEGATAALSASHYLENAK